MISRELASFLEGPVGIHLGTCSSRLEPSGARGLAVAVEPDGTHLVVYLARIAAERLRADLETNARAAVSLARPIDERACQVKGVFVGLRDAREDERSRVLSQWNSFRDNLEQIGIPRSGSEGWITWPCVAVRLRATELFEQTPRAGTGGALA